jgi:hypothetical protein
MITVLRIEGEGFDLSTGKDLPPGIVLSNGTQECVVFLEPLELRKVVQLYVSGPKEPVVDTASPDLARSPIPLPEVVMRAAPKPPLHTEEPLVKFNRGARGSYSDPDTGTDSV